MVSDSTMQLIFRKPPFVMLGIVSKKNAYTSLIKILPFPNCIAV